MPPRSRAASVAASRPTACASRSSRRITLSPANTPLSSSQAQDQPAARQPQRGAGEQVRGAGRQRVGKPQRHPQHLRAMRRWPHPAAGAPDAGSRRRRPPRSASRSPARERPAHGGPARCPAGAARAGTPARRGTPDGRGCRYRTSSRRPRAAGAPRRSRRGTAGRSRRATPAAGSGSRPSRAASSCPAASSGSCAADRLRHALHEPAFAQAAGAEHHAPHAGRPQHAAQRHRGKRQVVDAAPRQAGQPLQRAAAGAGDHAGQVARLLAADRVVMHHLQRIAGLRHVDTRQRAPRAADQIEVAARRPRSATAPWPGPPRRSPARAPDRRRPARPGGSRPGSASATPRARRGPAAPAPASRRRYRPGCRRRVGMPHSTPIAEYSASCRPESTRIGTPGIRACRRSDEVGAVARVAHRGGRQHLERFGAHRRATA